ncbi:hypothetical protein NITLEN_10282 [Nitrospira lenta]|uniref:Uncharacterized protein n=1 Tax=Nitrospira lenta TaxID=1436998 RepID=A0A330L8D4_9BACT|nr:hypothetical protein NITLEN_10282 [Nitrospira lenta]
MSAVAEKEPMSVDLGGDETACLTKITDALNQITRFTYDLSRPCVREEKRRQATFRAELECDVALEWTCE